MVFRRCVQGLTIWTMVRHHCVKAAEFPPALTLLLTPQTVLNKQAVKVSWDAAGRDGHELTGAFTPRLAGTCHLAITYAGAHIQGTLLCSRVPA